VIVAHSVAFGLMALVLGLVSMWIAGRELALGRAEHVTLFFHKQRVYERRAQPVVFWGWIACHGLGGLAIAAYGVWVV
jgi:hypothetical protein